MLSTGWREPLFSEQCFMGTVSDFTIAMTFIIPGQDFRTD